ncbi:hypothetical protein SAMN03159496_04669 [Rhizobium sp. NFR07]|nr:hypothetical protein [Rhizobium sp. NFR07]SFB52599.1 hypothetical protein SAMN03159496_04669 [Rhizobium sp. NFR07]
MFVEKESWFAWFPVVVRTLRGKRLAWLETVQRERIVSPYSSGPFRYYA